MNTQVLKQAGVASAYLVQIAADVSGVEARLKSIIQSPVKVVQDVCLHTLEGGGKRLRPAFLILSARAAQSEFSQDRALNLGATMELIHMATLIHDDVIDESATRRGRPTASTVFGNTASILSGDVLLAKAMCLLADDGDLRVIRTTAKMVQEMAEGEAKEVEVRYRYDLSVDEYLELIRLKTATFLQCCCEVGGLVANAPDGTIYALAEYGMNLGMAFQIIDDILDFTGDTAKTGKPKATDFREGCATLPLILAMEREPELQQFREVFGKNPSEKQIDSVIQLIENSGGFSGAMELAQNYLQKSEEALQKVPQNPHRNLLKAAGDFVLQRQH